MAGAGNKSYARRLLAARARHVACVASAPGPAPEPGDPIDLSATDSDAMPWLAPPAALPVGGAEGVSRQPGAAAGRRGGLPEALGPIVPLLIVAVIVLIARAGAACPVQLAVPSWPVSRMAAARAELPTRHHQWPSCRTSSNTATCWRHGCCWPPWCSSARSPCSVLASAMAVIFHHRHAETHGRHYLISAVMPYLYILSLCVGLLLVTLVSGALQLIGHESDDLLGAVAGRLSGVSGHAACTCWGWPAVRSSCCTSGAYLDDAGRAPVAAVPQRCSRAA